MVLLNEALLFLIAAKALVMVASDDTLSITCDNTIDELYLNGSSESPTANHYLTAETFNLPQLLNTVAVKCSDTGGGTGILASSTTGIVSNGAWRCSATLESDWYTDDFDDSHWQSCTYVRHYTGEEVSGISDKAQWIWTDHYNEESDSVIYARLDLTRSIEPPEYFTVVCDNRISEIYINDEPRFVGVLADLGKHQASFNLPETKDRLVIALKGLDWGGLAGVLGSSSTGILTGATWKCSAEFYESWYTVGFNDTNWDFCSVVNIHSTTGYAKISSDAKWIWTSSGEDDTIYLRYNNKLAATTDDVIRELYFNGEAVEASENNWKVAEIFDLPSVLTTIAGKLVNTGGLSGFIGSTDSGLVTSAAWRCSTTFQANWYDIDFDDNSWDHCTVVRDWDEHPKAPDVPVAGVSPEAKWIWTDRYNDGDAVIYSRVDLRCSLVSPEQLTVICDNAIVELYINHESKFVGLKQTELDQRAASFSIPSGPVIIAMKAKDWGGGKAVLASTTTGIVTNTDWKCSNTYEHEWYLHGFNDSGWDDCVIVSAHQSGSGWGYHQRISADANWIWTGSNDLNIYLRYNQINATDAANLPIKDNYIINGRPSEQGKFPWQVSLQRIRESGSFGHTCGGALLTPEWVLTASHCVMISENPEDYKVRVGAYQLSANDHADEIDVAEIVYHPDFILVVPGIPNDIALLRLARPADLSHPNVGTISLPSPGNDFSDEQICFISGWGRNDRDSDVPANVLQESPIGVLTNAQCTQWYEDLIDVTPVLPDHICIDSQGPDGVHACHGDSGGPLECQVNGEWVIAGVASRTGLLNCGDLGYPSVYIRVTEHLDFIREHVPGV